MTLRDMCEEIAKGFEREDIQIRNLATGRTIPDADGKYNADDIFNWSSHGELFHIWEWYAFVTREKK
jgi:hypothetical protein